MRVIDLINSNEKTAFSFEILPPLKGTGIEKLYQTIDTLREFDPKYINITTHRSEYVYKDLGNGLFQRNRLRRRPGTVSVAAAIQNKYNITVVPHILCSGFTREETEYVLLDLQFLGITDLLVLRGDKAKHESVFTPEGNGYHHAIELQEQINNFNKGIFVDGSEMKVTNTPFSYGVACYPEKHEEAPNIHTDIYWLKKKWKPEPNMQLPSFSMITGNILILWNVPVKKALPFLSFRVSNRSKSYRNSACCPRLSRSIYRRN